MARRGRRPSARAPEHQPPAPLPQQPEALRPIETHERFVRAEWAGPLPPPSVLRDYADVVPNGGERIFVQFENQSEHRRKQEDRDGRLKVRAVHIGQGLAGAFAATSFALTAYAIHEKAEWAAVVLGGSTLVSGVSAFLGLGIRRKPRA